MSPTLGLIVQLFITISKKSTRLDLLVIIVYISFLLGLINSTKFPENDLAVYLERYNMADNRGFFEYIFLFWKDPLFQIYTFFLNKILFSSDKLYVIFTTFLSYYLYLISILKILDFYPVKKSTKLIVIFFAALSPVLFSISAHLIRQFMATCLLVYFLAYKSQTGKNNYIVLLIAMMTHSSVILFAPFILLKSIKNKIKFNQIIYLFIFGVVLFNVFIIVATDLLQNYNLIFFEYAIKKALEGDSHELIPLSALNIFIILSMMIYFTISSLIKNEQDQIHVYTNIVLIISSIIFLYINNVEFSKRLYFNLYFFIPYLLITIINLLDRLNIGLKIVFINIILFVFVGSLYFSEWTYNAHNLINYPFIYLLQL